MANYHPYSFKLSISDKQPTSAQSPRVGQSTDAKSINRPQRQKNYGFTLIDLVITLCIFALLYSVGRANYSDFIMKAHLKEDLNSIYRVIAGARTRAISQKQTVSFCLADNFLCTNKNASQFISFHDENFNGIPEPIEIIYQITLSDSINWQKAGKSPRLGFNRRGHLSGLSSHFLGCPKNSERFKGYPGEQIIFSRSGRFRIAQDSNSDGFNNNASGGNIICNG